MSRSIQRNVVSIAAVVLAAACSAMGPKNVSPSSSDGAGTSGTGAGGSGLTISTGTDNPECNHDPDGDGDGDGWTGNEGDCNDCDPRINPGAIEVVVTALPDGSVPQPADEDCDGIADNPEGPCDSGLVVDDGDPYSAAKAVELCRFAAANPASKKEKTWGVLDARWVLPDGSEKAFPAGESAGLPLISAETAIQAGEHRLPVHPGKITRVPPVKKVDEFNMAQTNFYYQQGGSWVAFTERQLQFLDASRRVFIIHATPGAIQPTVTTIVDTNLTVAPR